MVDDRPDNSSRSIALAFTGVSEQALRRLIPDTDGDAPWRPKISGKAQSVSMKPLKQESQVERRPAGCKKAVVCVNEGVDNPEQWRVVTRRAYDRHYTRTRARCLDGLPRRAASVLGVCLDYTLEEPGPICFCQPCERFAKLDTVDQAEARVPSPIYKFFFAHEPVMPVPERPDAYMRPDAREHPIERIVGQRKARTRTSEDNMTTASHNPRELAEARPRVGDVFDHLAAAHDIETRIIERQLLCVRDEVLYPRHIRVESTRMRNVTLVEVACDKIARRLAEVAVDIPSPQPTLIMRPISAARPTRSSVRSTQRWRAR